MLREWRNDHEAQELEKLAYALGVGAIILASKDTQDFLGQYLYAGDSRQTHQGYWGPWYLSSRQLATINRALCSDRDVILLSSTSQGDFAATLAHELGHYINRRLGGLSRCEVSIFKDPGLAAFSRVTDNMRRVARFDEYFFQNKDEFYAETWSRFLCGDKNRSLFRYLNRPLDRLRMKHPQKVRLILELAKAVSARRANEDEYPSDQH